MKKHWNIKHIVEANEQQEAESEIISALLRQRGIITNIEAEHFFHPPEPMQLTPSDVGIDTDALETALTRIEQAIADKESIIVYADYDADGVTAGAVLWETIYALGGTVMPYIPHRQEEGYGLSQLGIDTVRSEYKAQLIVTVDHGISGAAEVAYAKSVGVTVVVTDHHTKPEILPDCPIVHTTTLSGSGVSWFVAKTLLQRNTSKVIRDIDIRDLAGIAAIGTIADLLPLIGPNRSLVFHGLQALSETSRVGILALFQEAGITEEVISTFDISHIIAPRINALGRLEHAMDALRLLCTTNEDRALSLASRLSEVNRERQNLTLESSIHAKEIVAAKRDLSRTSMLIVSDESYNPGIIGLIAGRLVEEYYLPAIVLAKGEPLSKASARSITGFNIVEAIKAQKDLLVDVGGHPMAAGFTIETEKLELFTARISEYANSKITPEMKAKTLQVDALIPLRYISRSLYQQLEQFAPFGMGNFEPIFADTELRLLEIRAVGKEQKHAKIKVKGKDGGVFAGIAFHLGDRIKDFAPADTIDLAFVVTRNLWNGKESIELKVKDIRLST